METRQSGQPIDDARMKSIIEFLQAAENLKNTLRTGITSQGRIESTAEHSWRLCLMVLLFADELKDVDLLHVIKLCIILARQFPVTYLPSIRRPKTTKQQGKDRILPIYALPCPMIYVVESLPFGMSTKRQRPRNHNLPKVLINWRQCFSTLSVKMPGISTMASTSPTGWITPTNIPYFASYASWLMMQPGKRSATSVRAI